jgi:hypothetical protein
LEEEKKRVLELVADYLAINENCVVSSGGQMKAKDVLGEWDLIYTSSRSFSINKSLSGLGRSQSESAKFGGLRQKLSGLQYVLFCWNFMLKFFVGVIVLYCVVWWSFADTWVLFRKAEVAAVSTRDASIGNIIVFQNYKSVIIQIFGELNSSGRGDVNGIKSDGNVSVVQINSSLAPDNTKDDYADAIQRDENEASLDRSWQRDFLYWVSSLSRQSRETQSKTDQNVKDGTCETRCHGHIRQTFSCHGYIGTQIRHGITPHQGCQPHNRPRNVKDN